MYALAAQVAVTRAAAPVVVGRGSSPGAVGAGLPRCDMFLLRTALRQQRPSGALRSAWAPTSPPIAARSFQSFRTISSSVVSADGGGVGGAAAQAQALVEWIEGAGGAVSGVNVSNAGAAGWCLSAATSISRGATIVKLPESCHLTYDASSDPRVLSLMERIPEELWGARLAVQVLSHRAQADGSAFAPYIALLPKAVEGLPMFFPAPAIQALQYPTLIAQVTKRCRFLVDFAGKELAGVVNDEARDPFSGQIVDANAFGWALAVVTSRAFRTKGPDHPAAMLPLIDMCNHSFAPNCEIRPLSGGGVALVAKEEVWPGQELRLDYGALGNDLLLLDYGFLVDDNPHDACQLRFDLPLLEAGRVAGSSDPDAELDLEQGKGPREWQKQMLSELELLDGRNAMVCIGGPPSQPVDKRLLAAARVMCASGPEEFRAMRAGAQRVSAGEAFGSLGRPLGDAVREAEALRMLLGVGALVMSQFPSTVKEDLDILSSGSMDGEALGSEMRLAVRFRTEMKKVLLRAMNSLSVRLKELPSSGGVGSEGKTKPGSGKAGKAEKARAKRARWMD
mmetsp:Transcript_40794/g.73307  ORF Transcript_40794/g.73307 Transcript_40794/m.73307 type:complete len:565 (-) Transcript_40794:260-1954(-)